MTAKTVFGVGKCEIMEGGRVVRTVITWFIARTPKAMSEGYLKRKLCLEQYRI